MNVIAPILLCEARVIGTFLSGRVTVLLAWNGDGPVPWWAYVLFLLALALVLILPRRLARRSRILPKVRMSETDRLKRSMDELLIQLQEVAREVNATMDTKMIALKVLVEEADLACQQAETKIAELQSLLEARRLAEAPSVETDTAVRSTSELSEPEAESRCNRDRAGERAQLEADVLRLAEEGRTELEIAQETGIPRGEIELMLALNRKTSPESPSPHQERTRSGGTQ